MQEKQPCVCHNNQKLLLLYSNSMWNRHQIQISIKKSTVELLSQNRLCDLSLTMIEKALSIQLPNNLKQRLVAEKIWYFLFSQWYSSRFSAIKQVFKSVSKIFEFWRIRKAENWNSDVLTLELSNPTVLFWSKFQNYQAREIAGEVRYRGGIMAVGWVPTFDDQRRGELCCFLRI